MARPRFRNLLMILSVLALVVGCGSTECDLTTSNALDPGTDWQVKYSATVTGDGSISRINYLDATGAVQTVTNPTLPWSLTVTIPAPGPAEVNAAAEVKDGSASVQAEASRAPADTIRGVDACSAS